MGLMLLSLSLLFGFLVSLSSSQRCNIYEGRWVFNLFYPLYNARDCPFISDGLNCQKQGRPDKMYLKYRWKPTSCDLPRFDGKNLLERYRGKKVMFVGDSLSKNQWQSMGCMLYAAVPKANYSLSSRGSLTSLYFPAYDFSLKLIKNGFLVGMTNRTMKLDTLVDSRLWLGHDVLIFNSYHWWLHTGRMKTWDNYQIGKKIYKGMDVKEAYRTALTTWAKWVDANVNPTKTRVFFQGISPVHYRGAEWGEPSAQDCRGQTRPVRGSTYPGDKPWGDEVVKNVLKKMKKPASLLDILLLSQLRKDGHPSTYAGGSDCSHWCLAGVPDAWNQLLYTNLLQG